MARTFCFVPPQVFAGWQANLCGTEGHYSRLRLYKCALPSVGTPILTLCWLFLIRNHSANINTSSALIR
jgi:hypothetical protein